VRFELSVPNPSAADAYFDPMLRYIPFALWLLAPLAIGLMTGAVFTWSIRRRGWRPQVISMWPISIMFGTLAYVIAPAIVFVALTDFRPVTIIKGLAASLLYVADLVDNRPRIFCVSRLPQAAREMAEGLDSGLPIGLLLDLRLRLYALAFALSAAATRLTGGRPMSLLISLLASTSFVMSTPVVTPRPSSM
jgi:hypothetical protein